MIVIMTRIRNGDDDLAMFGYGYNCRKRNDNNGYGEDNNDDNTDGCNNLEVIMTITIIITISTFSGRRLCYSNALAITGWISS